jgi:hypothetical protein
MKKKRRKAPATNELLPCINYLHGDVVDDEFRAACQYEYARESQVLRRAAQLLRNNPKADMGDIASQIESEFHCVSWFFSTDWGLIWQCPSFPEKGWNQLSDAERADLLCGLPISAAKVRPVFLGDLILLTPYLNQLKEIADKARAESKEERAAGRPRRKVHPILELKNTPFVLVLVPFDYRKSKKRILQEIDKWLELPENKARFDKHKPKDEAGTGKEAKDRLKDLAAWRLYNKLGCEKALEFAARNRKRDERGQPRPFHDPRQGQSKKVPVNEADLYSEESGFLKAKTRAKDYLAEIIPWEFSEDAKGPVTFGQEMVEEFKKILKRRPKDF